ncbi:MAG: S-layer homology domain-containing protein [Thermotaleaceae bacterium]
MKKLMSSLLITTVISSMVVGPSYAAGAKGFTPPGLEKKGFTPPGLEKKGFTPPGLEKKGGLPPGILKKFLDLQDVEWAWEAIEKMAEKGILKGIGEGQFAPRLAVTKIEALAIVIRAMDWEEEVEDVHRKIKENNEKHRVTDTIQDWAIGYANIAVDKGLMDEKDLTKDYLLSPATRQEVAKYIVCALGKGSDAENSMNKNLSFQDAKDIKEDFIGYVYMAYQLGIMTGNDKNQFLPNQSVTRAQMAVMASKLDRVDAEPGKEAEIEIFKGKITDIGRGTITVKHDNRERWFSIHSSTEIIINDKTKALSDLKPGMEVALEIEDGEVIKITTSTKMETIAGILMGINRTTKEITVRVGSVDRDIPLDGIATITLDGKNARISDLYPYMSVEVTLAYDKATYVKAASVEEELTGMLVEKVIGPTNRLTLKVSKENKILSIAKDAKILDQAGNAIDFEELKLGAEIKVYLVNQIVEKIRVVE